MKTKHICQSFKQVITLNKAVVPRLPLCCQTSLQCQPSSYQAGLTLSPLVSSAEICFWHPKVQNDLCHDMKIQFVQRLTILNVIKSLSRACAQWQCTIVHKPLLCLNYKNVFSFYFSGSHCIKGAIQLYLFVCLFIF